MKQTVIVGSFLSILVACSGGNVTIRKSDGSVIEEGDGDVMDGGGAADTSIGDSAKDAAGGDSGSDSGDAADSGPNPCWMGQPSTCGACCSNQVNGGAQAWDNAAGNCMCGFQVCGTALTCSFSICNNQAYSANCRNCLQSKFTANGPCASAYTACQQNVACKAWAACMLGCP